MKISTATTLKKKMHVCLSTQYRDQSKMPIRTHCKIHMSSTGHFSHAFKVIHYIITGR